MAQNDLFAAADPKIPDVAANTTIAALREEAAHCRRCDLYKYAFADLVRDLRKAA